MDQSTPTLGPWVDGKTSDSIVSKSARPTKGYEGDDVLHYGGVLIAESIEAHNKPLIKAAPEMLAALEATEFAEHHHANCEDCENSQVESPELGCEACFALADKARLMRRAAFAKAKGESIEGLYTEEQFEADARLRIAAPDLLGALKASLPHLRRLISMTSVDNVNARAALAASEAAVDKAKGEPDADTLRDR
jgi:hypothetical protein